MTAVDPVAKVEDLWEGYRIKTRRGWRAAGTHWALKGVNLTVAPGEALGVMGVNGSGKSTLLLCLSGVLSPDRGRIQTRGRVASLVDLSAGFSRELTGKENILMAGVLIGMSRDEVRRRYEAIADFAGLDPEVLDSPLRTYSAGMGLRIGFSLVVNSEPSVLLVDEVLAVGDQTFQNRCLRRVEELTRGGSGVVLVSHNLDLLRRECDRAVVLERGEVTYEGPTGEAVDFYLSSSDGDLRDQDLSHSAIYGRTARPRRRRLRHI